MSYIYQFKVTLMETKPKIWRRIQVSQKITFAEFSTAILCAMGWAGGHLHEFAIKPPGHARMVRIGRPEPEDMFGMMHGIVSETQARIEDYFLAPKDKAMYLYDFGDAWNHKVVLESILPAVEGETYPKCIAGKMACPPEDCGGISGFYDLLEILADPSHEEYEERKEWTDEEYGGEYDPTKFDADKVSFCPVM